MCCAVWPLSSSSSAEEEPNRMRVCWLVDGKHMFSVWPLSLLLPRLRNSLRKVHRPAEKMRVNRYRPAPGKSLSPDQMVSERASAEQGKSILENRLTEHIPIFSPVLLRQPGYKVNSSRSPNPVQRVNGSGKVAPNESEIGSFHREWMVGGIIEEETSTTIASTLRFFAFFVSTPEFDGQRKLDDQ